MGVSWTFSGRFFCKVRVDKPNMSELAHADVLVPRPPHYHSYLLRFWEERGETDQERVWRFMLQDPHTTERVGFANLDALVLWIQAKTMPTDLSPIDSPPKDTSPVTEE